MSDLEAWTLADATRLAYVLTGDADRAAAIGRRTYVRMRMSLQDLRDPAARDAWAARRVVRLAGRHARRDGDGLWGAYLALRPRARASLALRFVEEMRDDRVGDVLGCSAAGAHAAVTHALDALRHSLGPSAPPDLEEELATELRARASEVEVSAPLVRSARGRAAVLRPVGFLVAGIVVLGALAGGIVGARELVYIVEGEAEVERVDFDPGPTTPPPDLSPIGAPGWCPPFGLSRLEPSDRAGANSLAIRFAISLAKKYEHSIESESVVPEGAPPPEEWARPHSSSGNRIVQSGPATSDRSLERECGRAAADRTWKVVVREYELLDSDEVVAFYVARVDGRMVVWGTHRAEMRG